MMGIRPLSVALLAFLAVLVMPACQGYGEPVTEEPRVLRLVVFPAPDGGLDPSATTGLDRLAVVAGLPMRYLGRSGGGYLVATEEAIDAGEVRAILRRLLDHPSVANVQEDQRVRHQEER